MPTDLRGVYVARPGNRRVGDLLELQLFRATIGVDYDYFHLSPALSIILEQG